MLVGRRGVPQPDRDKTQLGIMVPEARLELALCFQNRILNPACLPIPPLRRTRMSVGIFDQNDKCRETGNAITPDEFSPVRPYPQAIPSPE